MTSQNRSVCLLEGDFKNRDALVDVTLGRSWFTWVTCKVFEMMNHSYQKKSYNKIMVVTSQNMRRSDMIGTKRTE